MADRVFGVTGWQPCSGCKGGNWQTPLVDTIMRHTSWTCQVVPLESSRNDTSIRVYRREKLKTHLPPGNKKKALKRGEGIFNLISGGRDERGKVMISSVNVPEDTYIYPVVEIYQGENQRHPISWANVPEPGPFSDWNLLNRMGKFLLLQPLERTAEKYFSRASS